MLRQLAFASRARPGLRASDTSKLITTSRSNNARDHVSGVLLYSGESFLQVVEGPDGAISGLWRRLLLDDRHHSIVSLFDLAVSDRWCDGWRAGYVSEEQLASPLLRWRVLAPALPAQEIALLRALCESTSTF